MPLNIAVGNSEESTSTSGKERHTMHSFWESMSTKEAVAQGEKRAPEEVVVAATKQGEMRDGVAIAKDQVEQDTSVEPPKEASAGWQDYMQKKESTESDEYVKVSMMGGEEEEEVVQEQQTLDVLSSISGEAAAEESVDKLVPSLSSNGGDSYADRKTVASSEYTTGGTTTITSVQDWGTSGMVAPSMETFDGDLDFVEQFDDAFNEYVARNPDFLIANPELVHTMRVTKLQLLLEKRDEIERVLVERLTQVQTKKKEMQDYYHNALREAARLKAAREINIQSEMSHASKATRTTEARMNWEVIESSAVRAKKHFGMLREVQSEYVTNKQELMDLLPRGAVFNAVREAIQNDTNQESAEQRQQQLRQHQMDHAFLQAEVQVLQKKLNYQKLAAKKNAWVESVLVRMDDKTMKKLKSKYQKKVGVHL